MTLKEFLQNKTLTAVELVNVGSNQVMNVYIDQVCYGLDIDTSNIPFGLPLDYRTDFILENDILSVADVTLDINTINML